MATPRRDARKRVYLIQPQFPPSYWGQEHFLKMTPFGAAYPPLGLITLAALTPPDYDVTVCDESAGEKIDFDTDAAIVGVTDRKSTRLNSSHSQLSYAVFCLKKKSR